MRKANQEIKERPVLEEILREGMICRIGMNNEEGRPYILPFNYGYHNNQLFIHCATKGRKIELLKKDPYVCFEIDDYTGLVKGDKACKWSSVYRSIVGYGKVEIVTGHTEKQKGLEIIMRQHGAPGLTDFDPKEVDSVLILKLTIDTMTGKRSGNWDKLIHQQDQNYETDRLLLTEISRDDLEEIHRLHSIPEVDEFNTLGIPQSMEETEQIMAPAWKARSRYPRSSYTWKICLKDSGKFIGMAGFTLSNDKFRLGEIYYKLDPEYWGKGYATETAKELVRIGFEEFDLQKVEAGVATGNTRSIRVLEKIGMTREGLRRKILPIRGEWKDNYHYAIVRSDERDY